MKPSLTRHREDAATAEVSRSQLWQWVRHGITTSEGKKVDKAYALRLLKECTEGLAAKAPKGNKYQLAAQYFAGQVTGEDYADFLTTYVFSLVRGDLNHSSSLCMYVGWQSADTVVDRLLYDEITHAGPARPAAKL